MLMTVFRVLLLYPLVVFSVRLMGKRQIGELQPAELVITILISNIATLSLEDPNLPPAAGLVPMLLLVCFEVLLSWGVLKNRRLRHLLAGSPKVIVRGGEIDQNALRLLRLTLDDLMTALRSNGIFDIRDVQMAVVETNGTVSVCPKDPARPVTCGDLRLSDGQTDDPPVVLVADGSVSAEGLAELHGTEAGLRQTLREQGVRVQDVFLLTADRQGICALVRKEKRNG